MKLLDQLEEIYLGVSSNKVRSGLTMLGIVIGIASVIAMLSIGQGAKSQIEANIQSIGSNLLLIMPGAQRGVGASVSSGRGSAQTLTQADAAALKNLPGVLAVAPELSRRYQVTARGKNTNTQIMGTSPAYLTVRNVALATGSFFSDTQVTSRAKVAVLGPTTRDDLFGADTQPIGERIRINGIDFTVIGVTAAKGGSGFSNQDDTVFIPVNTMGAFLTGNDSISSISVQAKDTASMSLAQSEATNALLTLHKLPSIDRADFNILNQSDLVSAASSVTDTFTALLASIASISLLVGGIGIMNMMLTTITERTREIGLRQAIGAEKGEIVGQFLGESILLTLMGGGIGILLGYIISKGLGSVMQLPTAVSWSSVGLAVGVSAAIGLIFGFYPARRAATLNPIEALRYE
ncbi:ABC transporter permease [Patescibacteria group bacterium]|nr:ABC transporter permease [Patescibacteria group bacterium]